MPRSTDITGQTHPAREDCTIRRFCGQNDLAVTQDDARFLLSIAFEHDHDARRAWIRLIVFVLLVGIAVTVFIAIRSVLFPITLLTEAVRQMETGHFIYRVPDAQRDELEELARAFNGTTDRIRQMVKGKGQLLLNVSHKRRSPLTSNEGRV